VLCEDEGVHSVEREIGYRFRNRELLRSATGVWRRSFGALEHLGDAIADLAVAVTCHRLDGDAETAAQIVANANLERVFSNRLRRLVRPGTGDVIEALIGAVHLDGGFDEAARVTNALLIEGVAWQPIPISRADALEEPGVGPVWVGALVLDAVVADRVVELRGAAGTSQRELSTTRATRTSTASLDRLVREAGARPRLPAAVGDARELKAAAASTMLARGWQTTRRLVVEVLEVGGPLARPARRGVLRQSRR
jgi:hypothetical protein